METWRSAEKEGEGGEEEGEGAATLGNGEGAAVHYSAT